MSINLNPVKTALGLAAIAMAIATDAKVNITHIAIGNGDDGGGAGGYAPDGTETALKNELLRSPISGYQQNGAQVTIEASFSSVAVVLAHEVGFILDDGTLFAVWSGAIALTDIYDGKSLKAQFDVLVTDEEAAVLNIVVPNDAAIRIDGGNKPTADIDWNNNLIKKLKDAVSDQDAINKRTMVAAIAAASSDYQIVEASMTAKAGDVLYVFSIVENIEITLPENTADKGDVIIHAMGGYPFVALRNGATIEGKADDLLFDRECKAEFVSFNGNWGVGITPLA